MWEIKRKIGLDGKLSSFRSWRKDQMRSALMSWLSEKYVHRSSALFQQEQYYIVSNERE